MNPEADSDPADLVTPAFVATARADVVSVEIDQEVVLYDDLSHRLHRLNATGATVWTCLDGSGTLAEIATDIAEVYGADEAQVLLDVLEVAREFARQGLLTVPEHQDLAESFPDPGSTTDERFIEEPSRCMDSTFALGQEGHLTLRVGQRLLGLRVNTPQLADAFRSVLEPSIVESPNAPPNVSIAETDAGTGRPLYYCYRSGAMLARRRSIRGAIEAAIAILGSYDQPLRDDSAADQLVRVEAVAAFKGGSTTLFSPESRIALAGLIPRLRAADWRTTDEPWMLVDPASGEVVVRDRALAVNWQALQALPADRLDGMDPAPGRYRVQAWVGFTEEGADPPGKVGRIVRVAAESPDLGIDASAVLSAVSNMLRGAAWKMVGILDAPSLARAVGA